MILRYLKFFLLALVAGLFLACTDDEKEGEFLLDREVTELVVSHTCASDKDSSEYCFQIRFHYPMDTEKLTNIYVWFDSTVVGDTAKAVNSEKLKKADEVIEFLKGTTELYGVIDVTPYVKNFVEELKAEDNRRDSVMVAFYCEYSDDERPGTVQRVYLHLGDKMPPSTITLKDPETWTTGAKFEWNRPADQTDYYAANDMSGPIAGYNIVVYALDEEEDISDIKVTVANAEGSDSTGSTIYKRRARFRNSRDSLKLDTALEYGGNYLRIAILDGKGYDIEDFDANAFSLVLEGLKAESRYTIGISAWDSSANGSGSEKVNSPWSNKMFFTTDSIAPLIGNTIITIKDTAFPELARLDSNNRLRIFWGYSVDPLIKNHGIIVDSALAIPDSCRLSEYIHEYKCIADSISSYEISYYDAASKDWVKFDYAGGAYARYKKLYRRDSLTGAMVVDAEGRFVTDTIRWVAPGDTMILRIRSKDASNYYSLALIDTIVVAPDVKSKDVECPEGFVLVSTSDTSTFCMERYEHRDDSGKFVSNVLHSEAVAACEALSGSGFTYGLCGEREWELVCLSGGTLNYGVIEESSLDNSDYLFANCNVATGDSTGAMDIAKRSSRCMNPMGVHDMPGQLQEWVRGRSDDTLAVLKGGSYKIFGGLDRETQARCTNRSFPYFTRPDYTKDTVYLYREGTKVDTVYSKDTSRTLHATIPSYGKDDPLQLSFKDTLQFFTVKDSSGNEIGVDYAPYAEYKNGGDAWLSALANGLIYEPDHVEVVFIKKEKVAYRQAAAFYKSPAIGFRCCAYK